MAAVRQKSDERWRETIRSIVLAGQEAGEFASVDADDFTIMLAGLLDGLAVQIALEDPDVPPQRAYELAMRFAAGQLQFGGSGPMGSGVSPGGGVSPQANRADWKPAPKRARKRGR